MDTEDGDLINCKGDGASCTPPGQNCDCTACVKRDAKAEEAKIDCSTLSINGCHDHSDKCVIDDAGNCSRKKCSSDSECEADQKCEKPANEDKGVCTGKYCQYVGCKGDVSCEYRYDENGFGLSALCNNVTGECNQSVHESCVPCNHIMFCDNGVQKPEEKAGEAPGPDPTPTPDTTPAPNPDTIPAPGCKAFACAKVGEQCCYQKEMMRQKAAYVCRKVDDETKRDPNCLPEGHGHGPNF